MKIDLPTNLLEFIITGILLEIVLILIIPGINTSQDFMGGLIFLSVSYILGLGVNAVSTPFFDMLKKKYIYTKEITKQKRKLQPVKARIKDIFDIDIDKEQLDLKQLDDEIENYVKINSEDFKKDYIYQHRIYRMSRNSFIISLIWILAFILMGLDIIPYEKIQETKSGTIEAFWFILPSLVLLSIALFVSTITRIKYLTGGSYNIFVALMRVSMIKEKEG